MTQVNRSALVPFSARQMFDVVNDVAAYPEFLPWCVKSRIHAEDDLHMLAELTIAKAGMQQSFTTRNQLLPYKSIQMELVKGPFKRLTGLWTFKQLGEEGCKVVMDMRFDVDSGLFNRTLAGIFGMAADKMVDAFCARAEVIYDQ